MLPPAPALLQVGVIINDRIDVALVAGADGVHVGQDDIPAAAARHLLGPDRILGVSVKTVAQAVRAQEEGADYLGAGAGQLLSYRTNYEAAEHAACDCDLCQEGTQ